jgi:hypothetical protein
MLLDKNADKKKKSESEIKYEVLLNKNTNFNNLINIDSKICVIFYILNLIVFK